MGFNRSTGLVAGGLRRGDIEVAGYDRPESAGRTSQKRRRIGPLLAGSLRSRYHKCDTINLINMERRERIALGSNEERGETAAADLGTEENEMRIIMACLSAIETTMDDFRQAKGEFSDGYGDLSTIQRSELSSRLSKKLLDGLRHYLGLNDESVDDALERF